MQITSCAVTAQCEAVFSIFFHSFWLGSALLPNSEAKKTSLFVGLWPTQSTSERMLPVNQNHPDSGRLKAS